MKKMIVYTVLGCLLCSCGKTEKLPTFPENPGREAYEGFTWEKVEENGLKFWAQKNAQIEVRTNAAIPGAEIVWQDRPQSGRTVMRLFYLPNGKIEDLLDILPSDTSWTQQTDCQFQEVDSHREGVKRYVLHPKGADEKAYLAKSKEEPIPATCNGWGVGNSGIRYFEIHANHPELALFVEIGQDAPLFDEQSILITDSLLPPVQTINPKRVKGTLTLGHETRSFRDADSQKEYWMIDRTGQLYARYDSLTQGIKNGTPVEAELYVKEAEHNPDGFAADYTGTYQIIKIINLKEKEK